MYLAGRWTFIDLPLYRKGTYVAGTQLLAWQAEVEVPGRKPDPITWLVLRGVWPMNICEKFVPPHCTLEMDMCWVPYPLALSEPEVHRWKLWGLLRPGEEWGLETEYALKWCKAGGGLSEGVLGILCPGEESAPAVLIVRAVRRKVTSELLDLTLSLAICLGMVSGR